MNWRLQRLRAALLDPPLEPMVYPTLARRRWVGWFIVLGNPLFAWVWGVVIPQPYENIWVRAALVVMGVPLVLSRQASRVQRTEWRDAALIALAIPVFFWWMFWMNRGSEVWTCTVAVGLVMHYQLTDWRVATAAQFVGLIGGWVLAQLLGAAPISTPALDAILIGFAWAGGGLLGFFAADLRRERLDGSIATIGIMAHELRTPLATMSMIGQAVHQAGDHDVPHDEAHRLRQLGQRLQTLVRQMNHQIDLQIANARLLHLPAGNDCIDAAALAQQVVAGFPFRTEAECSAVELQIMRNFRFCGSAAQFHHVLDNLLKNALRAVAAVGRGFAPGDIRICIDTQANRGTIRVTDCGIGVDAALAPRVFDAFFSTDRGTGHGLGLAFCQRVVSAAGGTISLKPERRTGATFLIELPLLCDP